MAFPWGLVILYGAIIAIVIYIIRKQRAGNIAAAVYITVTPAVNECCICLDGARTHMTIPCGHLAYCDKCIYKISICSICRTGIEKIIKVYE